MNEIIKKVYSGEVYSYELQSVNVKYIWKYENANQKLMICDKIIFLVFVKILTILYWHDRHIYIPHCPITDIESKHNGNFRSYMEHSDNSGRLKTSKVHLYIKTSELYWTHINSFVFSSISRIFTIYLYYIM